MLAQVHFDMYLWDTKLESINNNESVSYFALFRFFNLSRIQDNAILSFLNTSNDLMKLMLVISILKLCIKVPELTHQVVHQSMGYISLYYGSINVFDAFA